MVDKSWEREDLRACEVSCWEERQATTTKPKVRELNRKEGSNSSRTMPMESRRGEAKANQALADCSLVRPSRGK